MILSIFALLLIVSLTLVFLGYYLQGSGDILKFTGFCFIFLLGVMLLPETPGAIEYQTGEVRVTDGNTTTVTHEYADYESHSFGLFLSLIGGFGFAVAFTDRNSKPKSRRAYL